MTRSDVRHDDEPQTEGPVQPSPSGVGANPHDPPAVHLVATNNKHHQQRRLVALCLLLFACCVAAVLAPPPQSSSIQRQTQTLQASGADVASRESSHQSVNDALPPLLARHDDSQPSNSQGSMPAELPSSEDGRNSALDNRFPASRSSQAGTPPPSPADVAAGRRILESFARVDCGDMLEGVPSEPKAPYSHFRAHTVETSPVCISKDAYFYRLQAGPARTFQSKRATFRRGATERRDFTLERAFFRPMTDAVYAELGTSVIENLTLHDSAASTAAQVAKTTRGTAVLHRSLGIFNGAWYNYHMFHCLIDALVGFNAVEVQFQKLLHAPQTHVWISNFLLNRYDGGKPKLPWNITLEFLRRMNSPAYPPIVILADGVVQDRRMHCFCGAAVTHSIEFRHRDFLLREPPSLRSGRQGMALQIQRLVRGFELPPHGVEGRTQDLQAFQRYGWYKTVRSTDVPRMMVVLRQVDRRINADFFQRIGESVGFAVQLVRLERYSVEEQVALARFSDVLVAVHGAGATLQMFMDTAGFNQHCRTWIELVPWVQRWKLPVMMHQSILANISHEAIDAVSIIFDSSVPRSLRRTVLRSKTKYSVGAFEYLHVPHELVYAEKDVRRVMMHAKARWQTCGARGDEAEGQSALIGGVAGSN